jgi:hypothetical protein
MTGLLYGELCFYAGDFQATGVSLSRWILSQAEWEDD